MLVCCQRILSSISPPWPQKRLCQRRTIEEESCDQEGSSVDAQRSESELIITDTYVKVTMPVVSAGMDSCSAMELHTFLDQLLLKYECEQFKWMLSLG